MDEAQRQSMLQETVSRFLESTLDLLINRTGSNIFNASGEWAQTYSPAPLLPEGLKSTLGQILSMSRRLTIPTEEIPDAWEGLVACLDEGRKKEALSLADSRLQEVSLGLQGPHGTTFGVLVRFLHCALERYESEGIPVLRQAYQMMLGPPGAGRIGIREAIVHGASTSTRVPDATSIARVLSNPFGEIVNPGWQLSSLARHVRLVSPKHARLLVALYSVLPVYEPKIRALILSPFKMNNVDNVDQDVVDGPAEVDGDPHVLALLNQLSEMYV